MKTIHIIDPNTDKTVIVPQSVFNDVKKYMDSIIRDSAYINVNGRKLVVERVDTENQ